MDILYGEDLAWVHNSGFGDLCKHAGTEALAALQIAGIASGRIVDLGCGGGTWAARALSAGFSVLGADVSDPMLHIARAAAPSAEFRRTSLYDVEIPPCVAVTAFGEALNYGTPEPPTASMLANLFQRASRSLAAGGLFMFDVLVQSDGPPMRYRTWTSGPDYAVLVEARENADAPVLRRDIVVFRKIGDHYRRSEEQHALAVFEAQVVESLLWSAGFVSRRARHYGDWELPERRLAFFARKPCV